jgi:tetratricopeptide (TPR) repeat protein
MNYIELCRQGDALFEQNQFEAAIPYYDQAIALRPQYVSALYRKGESLYKLGRFLESAHCFWSAYLFYQFRPEPLMMCGRALEAADSSFEACTVFGMTTPDRIDNESMVFYISSLVREGRIADAAALISRLEQDHSFNANLLRGRIVHEFGLMEQAKAIFEPLLPNDDGGKVADRLVGIYMGLGLFEELNKLLDYAINLYSHDKNHADYYSAVKIALGVFFGQLPANQAAYKDNVRYPIIESAEYLFSKTQGKITLTGSSQQTFATVLEHVSPTGIIAEFGVRNGHTINLLAKLYPNHRLYGFDSFVGIPEDWNEEAAGSYSAGGKLPRVADNVTLVHGWFDKTLPVFAQQNSETLALLNVDCDLYSSTKTIFDCLGDRIIAGTVIIFDEYICNKSWKEDEFKAFQEWVAANNVQYEYLAASFYTKQTAVKILSKG